MIYDFEFDTSFINDEAFIELFGENDDNDFPDEDWGQYVDDEGLAEHIQEAIASIKYEAELTPYEALQLQEAFPAIIGGLVSAAVPLVKKLFAKKGVKAAAKIVPKVLPKVGQILNKVLGGKKATQSPAPPPVVIQTPLPPQNMPAPRPAAPITAAGGNALGSLLQLIQNPMIMQMLMLLAGGRQSSPLYMGQNNVPVREGAVLNAIAQFAQKAKMDLADEQYADALEYLKNDAGELAVDITNPAERAERLVQTLNS